MGGADLRRVSGLRGLGDPPNGQGIAALQALGIVEGTAMHESPHGSAESWHCQIEAMKIAFADAYRYVADPRRADVPISGMLDARYLASRRAWSESVRKLTARDNPRAAGRCISARRIATA